ncbi:MAG: redoxin family protein [Deltaproteobacteria bacterium]|nr:redoxin family protein [Deltaproteobacteria bacterium]
MGFSLMFAAGLWASRGFAGGLFDAALTRSDGHQASLSQYRGKPVILFYEDKGSTHVNRPLKGRLREWGDAHAAHGAAHVVAVTNLQAYNFFPVKGFALRRVRGMEEKLGIPILADLDGTMTTPPWSLPPHASTVVLFDSEGNVVYQKTGAFSEDDIATLLAVLDELI